MLKMRKFLYLMLIISLFSFISAQTIITENGIFLDGYVNASIFNGVWNGSGFYALNTTFAIQTLINNTGIYSIPLSINTTKNIQELLNSTGIYNQSGANNLTISQLVNLTLANSQNSTTLSCSNITGALSDLCSIQTGNVSGTGSGNTTQEIRNAVNDSIQFNFISNSTLFWGGITFPSLPALIVSWVGNWTNDKADYYTKTETNLTASQIANLSISQTTGMNSSWNQSFANSLYAPNTTAGIQILINDSGVYSIPLTINSTKNIQELYNATAVMIAQQYAGNSTFNQSLTDSLYTNQTYVDSVNTTQVGWIEATFLKIANFIKPKGDGKYLYNDSNTMYLNETKLNESIDIRVDDVYNDTNLILNVNNSALHIGEQNKTILSCSNLTGAVSDLCSIQTGNLSFGNFYFENFSGSFLSNISLINNSKNIQELYNLTASMIANISISQIVDSIYASNLTVSQIANLTISQLALISNVTVQQYINMINNTNTISQLYNFTASQIANLSISQIVDNLYAPNTTAGIQYLINGSSISFNKVNATNVTAGWFNGKWNGTSSDDWLSSTGNIWTFNSSKLATSYFNASLVAVLVGTPQGSSADMNYIYDDKTYNISETGANPGFSLRLNFSGITNFNQVIIRYKTVAPENHDLTIQFYNDNTATWENYGYLTVSTDFSFKSIGVLDPSNHISSGVVQLRLLLPSAGNTGHKWQFDMITISSGYASLPSQEIDPLSFHKNTNLEINNYNITGIDWLESKSLNVTGTSYLGNLIINADNVTLNNILNKSSPDIKFWANILPSWDNILNLGSSTFRWNNLFVSNIYSNGTILYNNGIDVSILNDTTLINNLINSLNTTYNIGNLYNATASMIANLSISQIVDSIYATNLSVSQIANISFNQMANTTIQQYVNMINNTNVVQQLINGTSITFNNLNVTNITNAGTIYAGNITYYANGCYRKINDTGIYDIC